MRRRRHADPGRVTLAPNIRRLPNGKLYTHVTVGSGSHKQQRSQVWPADTAHRTLTRWVNETRVALRSAQRPSVSGTLMADIGRYLTQVSAMPTYAQREAHLAAWETALGADTLRSAITPEQIRNVLQRWRKTFSAATCNKRRTALMHLWSVLDGKGARNPVRDVPKFRVSDPVPRGRDPHALDAALLEAPPCRSRAACRVILWTGARPCELDRASPDDWDHTAGTLILRTAKGGRTRVVPLTSQGTSALQEFDDADGWQHVPQAAPLGRWLKDAVGIPGLRVYDLRHSYGTALARRGTRLDVIAALMGHSTLELTRRYTLAAVTPDAETATKRLDARLDAAPDADKH